MVSRINPHIRSNGIPVIHSPATLNCPNCAKKIIIARPFTNPSITVWGISLMSFPNFRTPKSIWKIPIKTTVAKRYSIPCCATKETIMTASAPVAPEIIPGLPPNNAVIKPTINAAYNPTKGCTPATKAKAIASGIRAKATVNQERMSDFICPLIKRFGKYFFRKISNIETIKKR